MNGFEHYQRAEELIAQATRTTRHPRSGVEMCLVGPEEANRLFAQAHVHATLALAAANLRAAAVTE